MHEYSYWIKSLFFVFVGDQNNSLNYHKYRDFELSTCRIKEDDSGMSLEN